MYQLLLYFILLAIPDRKTKVRDAHASPTILLESVPNSKASGLLGHGATKAYYFSTADTIKFQINISNHLFQ
jgi:hypothetical protein